MERTNTPPLLTLPIAEGNKERYYEQSSESISETPSEADRLDDYYNRASRETSAQLFFVSAIGVFLTFGLYGLYELVRTVGLVGELSEPFWFIISFLILAVSYWVAPHYVNVHFRHRKRSKFLYPPKK